MPDRLFRALLRLLPEEWRAAYAHEIEVTFRAERRELGRSASRLALTGLWFSTVADLLRNAPARHWDVLSRDIRYGVRVMLRHPVHSLTAIVVLALGIGANVAMFAVTYAVLFAPLPYGDPGSVVAVEERSNGGEPGRIGYLTFLDIRARARSFTAMAATSQSFAALTGSGREPERVAAMRVSASYFDVVRTDVAIGRTFSRSEDRPGTARRVAIIGNALWRRRYNADPSIVGRSVLVSGIPYTVVGVMPPRPGDLIAERLYGGAELLMPLGYDAAAAFACRTCRHLSVFGRLRPGLNAQSGERELSSILHVLATEHPGEYNRPSASVQRVSDYFLGPVRPVLLALSAGVAMLLLVACANVGNLLLLRASERRHEVAVRAALGVTRGRLARQLFTESMILAVAGGAVALLPAWAAIKLVALAGPAQLPRLAAATFDGRALLAAVGLTALSGILFGLVPLHHLHRCNVAASMHPGGHRVDTAGAWRLRALLAAGNVALSTVLLIGAALLVRSMFGLLAVAPGIDTSNVIVARVELSGSRYSAPRPQDQVAAASHFYESVLAGLRASPLVEHASASTALPLSGDHDQYGVHIAGRPLANPGEAPNAHRFVIQPDFFDTLRVPVVRGRAIAARDGAEAARVAVINQAGAEQLFHGENPIGRQIMLGDPDAPARTIVGVVGDVRHEGLDVAPGIQVYAPQSQWAWAEGTMALVVRARSKTVSLAPLIRQAVRDVDPLQPVFGVRSYDSIIGESIGARRFAAWVLAAFSVTALLLAVVGLSGSLWIVVGLRRREIGIRLALGAGAAAVRRMVLAQGMRPAVGGLALGLALSVLTVDALRALLFGVEAQDPATFAGVAMLLLIATLGACLLPAWRAAKVDPGATLRAE